MLLTDVAKIERIPARLANMRKPQEFIVYPRRGDGLVMVQSDKSIGVFDPATGRGRLSTRGAYFPHLALYGVAYDFPPEFVAAAVAAQPAA